MKILSKMFVERSNDFAKYQHAIGYTPFVDTNPFN